MTRIQASSAPIPSGITCLEAILYKSIFLFRAALFLPAPENQAPWEKPWHRGALKTRGLSTRSLRIPDVRLLAFPDRVLWGEEIDALVVDVAVFFDLVGADGVVGEKDDCLSIA
jgi:hypothetical protein